ncbi:MAG TPA: peptidase S8 [Cyanothece sp. UBA12306]|nr:peptidase S8 [Cyanothece sp. UBA12306]
MMIETLNQSNLDHNLIELNSSSNNYLNLDSASLLETQSSNSIALNNYEAQYVREVEENLVSIAESKTKDKSKSENYNEVFGYGVVNAAAAVAEVLDLSSPFPDVSNVNDSNWGVDAVQAPEVWEKGYTGEGIVVAVLDTGVDVNHQDLDDNIWVNTGEIAGNGIDDDGNGYVDDVYGWNFSEDNNNILDLEGHGTHVAGTIAAENNGVGVTGIAYNAEIMAVKVLDDSGYGTYKDIADGIYYAVDNGADVINMSIAGSSKSNKLKSAIEYASSQDVIVVSAAGNNGNSKTSYPARYAKKWGLAVGAVDSTNTLANFSNHAGKKSKMAYVTAPGVDIYSTLPDGDYGYKSGTSMATPHVAGVVALMLSANESLTDAEVRSVITATAENTVNTNDGNFDGPSKVPETTIYSIADIVTESQGISVTNRRAIIEQTPIYQNNQNNDDLSNTDESSLGNNPNTNDNQSSSFVSVFPLVVNSVTQINQSNGQGINQNPNDTQTNSNDLTNSNRVIDDLTNSYGANYRYYDTSDSGLIDDLLGYLV